MDVVTLGMAKADAAKRYKRGSGRARVVVVGDSITYNFSGGPARLAVHRSGRALWGGHFATQGYTLAQIRATHLPQVLALTGWDKPSHCIIAGGTNDAGANNGTTFNLAASRAELALITNALVAAGIVPILTAVPPRTEFAITKDNVRVWNSYVRMLAVATGYPLIDYYGACGNVAGDWKANLSGDLIHPNGVGNRVMADAAATVLNSIFQTAGPHLSRSYNDPGNLMPTYTGTFTAAIVNGVAGGWGGSGTGCVYTVDATDAAIAGNWQSAAKGTAATANAFMQLTPTRITSGWAVGDKVAFSCLYKSSGLEANINQNASASVECRDAANTILASYMLVPTLASDTTSPATAYVEGLVVPGTTYLNVSLSITGTATTTAGAELRLAQVTGVNLTTLGLA